MKTTIDIPEKLMRETIKHTSAKTKRDAVITALEKFNRLQRLRELNSRLRGTFVDFMTQDDLKVMREAAWCDMVMLELWNGARGQEEKRKLAELSAIAPRLETSSEVWELAHRLAARCRDKGKTVPAADVLVAACAIHHEVELEHKDGH